MLATLLFSAAFTTGETLANSIRTQALKHIGEVDVVVKAKAPDTADQQQFAATVSRASYFDEDLADKVSERLADDEEVAGVAPLASETVPVASAGTDLSEPRVDVLGMDQGSIGGFDRLKDSSGHTLLLDDLGESEVYVSRETAEELNVGTGHEIKAFVGRRPVKLEVAGVYVNGANPASETSIVMSLDELQELTGTEGKINNILITHRGPAVEGGAHTDATVDALRNLLSANDLRTDRPRNGRR